MNKIIDKLQPFLNYNNYYGLVMNELCVLLHYFQKIMIMIDKKLDGKNFKVCLCKFVIFDQRFMIVVQIFIEDDKNNIKGETKQFASRIGFQEILRLDTIDEYRIISYRIMKIKIALGIVSIRQNNVNEVYITMYDHSISIDKVHTLLLVELMKFIEVFQDQGIDQFKNSSLILESFDKKNKDVIFNVSKQEKQDSMNGISQ